MSTVTRQGHIPGGGAIIGADYPWLVYGVGSGDKTTYRIMNCESGEVLPDVVSSAKSAQTVLDKHLRRPVLQRDNDDLLLDKLGIALAKIPPLSDWVQCDFIVELRDSGVYMVTPRTDLDRRFMNRFTGTRYMRETTGAHFFMPKDCARFMEYGKAYGKTFFQTTQKETPCAPKK